MTEEKRQDDKGGKDRMTKKKYVILREPFTFGKDDRRISLHCAEILR